MKVISFFLSLIFIISFSFVVHAEQKNNNLRKASAQVTKKKVTSSVHQTKKSVTLTAQDNIYEENESTFIRHRVKRGETLAEIARMYGVSIREIKSVNRLKTQTLSPGKILVIPQREEEEEEEIVEVGEKSFGKWKDPDERYRLVKVAKSFEGAPYKLGGSTVRGLDCSAFVKKIFEIFDVNLPRTAKEQYRVGKKIEKEELTIGDLVFFKTRPGRNYPTHVGIYIGNGTFIHASSHHKRGVRVDSLDSPFYKRTYVGAVRIKELPDDLAEKKDRISSESNS
ncbi:MAG: NlpC/P60 family protein [Deltaproteobacteria bacterium]|nr:NlpC/P60 family protein [Deltaproteobacteria bacterium]